MKKAGEIEKGNKFILLTVSLFLFFISKVDAQSPNVKWWYDSNDSSFGQSAAGDIDNDGKPEILHGEFGGYVICINGENGSKSWEIPVDLNSWIQTAPTIVDLDNNGQLDFVVGTWNFDDLDSIYAYRGDDHSLLWTYPILM